MPELNATLETLGSDRETVTISDPTDAPDIAVIQARAAKAEAELADLRNRAKEAATKEAVKRGEYERLYAEAKADADAKAARLADLEAREAARLERVGKAAEAAARGLPREMQALVAKVKGKLDADEMSEYIDTLKASMPSVAVGAVRASGVASGAAKFASLPPESQAKVKAEAAQVAKAPEWWFDNVWKGVDRLRKTA